MYLGTFAEDVAERMSTMDETVSRCEKEQLSLSDIEQQELEKVKQIEQLRKR